MSHRILVALALLLAWACSDDDEPPPGVGHPNDAGAGNGTSGTSGRSGTGGASGSDAGGSGGAPDGGVGGSAQGGVSGAGDPGGQAGDGAGGTAGSAGSAGFPACPSDTNPGAPPDNALCDPLNGWGVTMDLPLMDGATQLVSITPDELTIAWVGTVNMYEMSYVADRATVDVSFGTGQELAFFDYVALSPDGLRLVTLTETGEFMELVRSARGEMFAEPVEGTFSTLDAHARTNALVFLGATISPDDRALYYLESDGQEDQPLRISTRTSTGPWPVGTTISACEFQAYDGLLRLPTGISADGLTLYFNDFVRGVSRAAWREVADGPFVWFKDLGTRGRPQPNQNCGRLYFTATTGPAYAEAD